MDVHLDVWRLEIPTNVATLHRKSARWKCWKTLRGNAKKIFFYIYIYIPKIILWQHFLLFWAFFVWMERELIRCPTHQLSRGLECASCSPRHPFKVNSSCLVHVTDSCGKRHCNFSLEAVELSGQLYADLAILLT